MKVIEAILLLSFLFFGFHEAFSFSKKLICRQGAWKREFINITTQKISHPLPIKRASCDGYISLSLEGKL